MDNVFKMLPEEAVFKKFNVQSALQFMRPIEEPTLFIS